MADESTIKTKLQMSGGADYRKELKLAQDKLAALTAEYKEETSALKSNSNAESINQKRVETLREKISAQQQVVETMKKALEDATTKYGENSSAVYRWRTRLANAQTALNNLNAELNNTGEAAEEAASGIGGGDKAQSGQNMSDALDKLGDAAKTVGAAVQTVFTNLVDKVKQTTEQIIELVNSAMSTAGEWQGVADIYGGSASTAEELYRITSMAGNESSDMDMILQKLVYGNQEGSFDITQLLGADFAKGENEDALTWVRRVMDELARLKDAGEDITPITTELFGKGGFDNANALIAGWTNGVEKWQQVSQSGGLVSSDSITYMDNANHRLAELQTTLETLRDTFGFKMGETIGVDVMLTDSQGLLTNLLEFLSADSDEARSNAILKVTGSIELLSTDLTTALSNLNTWLTATAGSLSGSDSPVLQMIGTIMQALSGALDWLSDPANTETIKTALKMMVENKIVEWTTGKSISDWAGDLFSVLKDILSAVILISTAKGLGLSSEATSSLGSVITSAAGTSALGAVGAALGLGTAYFGTLVAAGQYAQEHPENSLDNEEHVTNGLTSDDTDIINAIRAYDTAIATRQGLEENGEFGTDYDTAVANEKNARDALQTLSPEYLQKYLQWEANNGGAGISSFLDENFGTTGTETVDQDAYNAALAYMALQNYDGDIMEGMDTDAWMQALMNKYGMSDSWAAGIANYDPSQYSITADEMKSAVSSGLSGAEVKMDGVTVGRLITPYVNQNLATQMQ